MSTGWENHEPSPIEFMHGRLMDEFHKWRKEQNEPADINVIINGIEFSKIVAAAKLATYEKYKALGLDKPVLKSKLL
jgi:cobalamin biosynthesis Co2+ chelatase CbiK